MKQSHLKQDGPVLWISVNSW